MIVSRAAELGRLDEFLQRLRAGDGGALVVHGEPGIGKTTLLDALAARVRRRHHAAPGARRGDRGRARVLRAGGPPRARDRAPRGAAGAAVRRAGRGARARAAGARRPPRRLRGDARPAARRRGARPVLAVVDDVHWLDAASRECVALRGAPRGRAGRGRAGCPRSLAARSSARGSPSCSSARSTPPPRWSCSAASAPDLAPPVAAALAEAAAGNPLALVELPAHAHAPTSAPAPRARAAARAGRAGCATRSRAGSTSSTRPRATRCSSPRRTPATTWPRSAPRAGAGRTASGSRRPRSAGSCASTTARCAFAHPIIRGAAYHAVGPARAPRRPIARSPACSTASGARGISPRRRSGPTSASRRSSSAAAAPPRRGAAFAPASAALERAARLSPARRRRAPAARGGRGGRAPRARRSARSPCSSEAAGVARDDGLRARARSTLRGRMMVWSGRRPRRRGCSSRKRSERPAAIRRSRRRCSRTPPTRCTATNSYHRAEALARRAAALLGEGGDPPSARPVLAMLGWALVLRGKAPARPAGARRGRAARRGLDPLGPHWPWQHLLLRAPHPAGRVRARAAREPRPLRAGPRRGRARHPRRRADRRRRRRVPARRLGPRPTTPTREAIRVAGDTGQHSWHGYALTIRARLAGGARAARTRAARRRGGARASPSPSGIRSGAALRPRGARVPRARASTASTRRSPSSSAVERAGGGLRPRGADARAVGAGPRRGPRPRRPRRRCAARAGDARAAGGFDRQRVRRRRRGPLPRHARRRLRRGVRRRARARRSPADAVRARADAARATAAGCTAPAAAPRRATACARR